MADLQPVPQQSSWTPQIFTNFTKFLKKADLLEKLELLENRGFALSENRNVDIFLPPANPICKLNMTSMVWNTSIGQIGYLSVCAPSQLRHTCLLAEYGKLEKILDLQQQRKTSVLLTFFSR